MTDEQVEAAIEKSIPSLKRRETIKVLHKVAELMRQRKRQFAS
jgi:acyl-CoA reductase-like NAD-dependent aldehyde dehydrogenase